MISFTYKEPKNWIRENITEIVPSKTPLGIYGFRRMVNNYSGNCVRIRRVINTDECNFTINGYGEINEDAIKNFMGADNEGYISKFYNQTGDSTTDVYQDTLSQQPKIFENNAVIRKNGKISMRFIKENNNILVSNTINGTDSVTVFAVSSIENIGSNVPIIGTHSGLENGINGWNINFTISPFKTAFRYKQGGSWFTNSVAGETATIGELTLVTGYKKGLYKTVVSKNLNNEYIDEDGNSGPIEYSNNPKITIGGKPAAGNGYFDGYISEFVIYGEELASNEILAIKQNIVNYFGIV